MAKFDSSNFEPLPVRPT